MVDPNYLSPNDDRPTPTMTRQHFVVLAGVVASLRWMEWSNRTAVYVALRDVCEASNENFDADRFHAASFPDLDEKGVSGWIATEQSFGPNN